MQWAIGSPTRPGDLAVIPLTFDQSFSGSFTTQLNITTGEVERIGPDEAVHTILVVANDPNGGYNGQVSTYGNGKGVLSEI